MKTSVRTIDGVLVVSVAGDVESRTAGHLYDVLVECAVENVGQGRTRLIVDLSGVESMTRAGVRGLFVAAKLMDAGRGEMRICGADPKIFALLKGLGFKHLMRCDPTLAESLTIISDKSAANESDQIRVDPQALNGAQADAWTVNSLDQTVGLARGNGL